MKNKEYTHCNISDTILTNFNNREDELEFIRDLFCHKGVLSYDEYCLWSKKIKERHIIIKPYRNYENNTI